MSYSRSLRVLIIEDEADVIGAYQFALLRLKSEDGFDLVDPIVAGGVDDAITKLETSSPFHVVVLDLKLPATAGGDPDAHGRSGLDLLDVIIGRDGYPIPVLLILTGQPTYIQSYGGLSETLQNGMYKGFVEQKGLDPINHFRKALEAAQQYVDFGIRIVDNEERPWPPVTTREEDLIRRFGLTNPTYAGVDLQWWSAERKDEGGDKPIWSKVLMGHFWLKDHDMETRSYFFKLEAREHGEASLNAIRMLEGALQHVQVPGQLFSGKRSLVMTAQATVSGNPPIALGQFLRRPSDKVGPQLESIANDIADQLEKLGTASDEPKAPSDVVWKFHELQIEKYDAAYVSLQSADELLPSKLMAVLKASTEKPWIKWRSCQHGDLHLGNVSVDEYEGQARGFLIDAGSMESGPAGKDLAAFEIALVLHQTSSTDTVLEAVKGMFDGSQTATSMGGDLATNTVTLLQCVRKRAMQVTDEATYRLLLLDQALIQLGSLAYGSFGNKIVRPSDAVAIYRSIAGSYLSGLKGIPSSL